MAAGAGRFAPRWRVVTFPIPIRPTTMAAGRIGRGRIGIGVNRPAPAAIYAKKKNIYQVDQVPTSVRTAHI